MDKNDLRKFMSGGVAAAISGEEAKAAAFWAGLATLKEEWKMDKSDLCTLMSGGVAAAISGDEDEAAAFWDGLRLLQPELTTSSEIATFVCSGMASRLKKGQGINIVAVIERLGPKRAKAVLKGQPLLRVLPEFVGYMSTTDDDELWSAINTRDKRKCLVEDFELL